MHRVLVPVDRNVQRATRQAEFVTAMPCAPDELEVKVIHVNEADYEGARPREFDDIEAATTAVEMIEDADIECEGEMWEGNIARNILDAAEEFDADQLVMAGRDRSGVAKVLLGSVSQDVVLSTDRAVTIIG
mgnify:CR=1 FL=1